MFDKELLAKLRALEIHSKRLAHDQLSGDYHSSFKGHGLQFREVRPYLPGDDVRTIDWNVSARMNSAHVKVFTEERERSVMLVVDTSQSLLFGTGLSSKARVATEVAALLALSALEGGDRIGLILGSSHTEKIIAPRKGEKHVMRLLRDIFLQDHSVISYEPDDAKSSQKRLGEKTNLKAILETLVASSKRKGIAFVISDFLSQDYESTLGYASKKHDLVAILLRDFNDLHLPDVGLLEVYDLEVGDSFTVDTSNKKVRAYYHQSMQKLVKYQRDLFARWSIDSVEIDTRSDPSKVLRDLFHKRAKRARR